MGMQGGWARWMVTAGGGGRRIQPGWRALGCDVLGVMLGICRRGVLVAFYSSAASAAESRHFGERAKHGACCMCALRFRRRAVCSRPFAL